MTEFISSSSFTEIQWSDTAQFASEFGVKAATSLAIPRAWTPPFIALSVALSKQLANSEISGLTDSDGTLSSILNLVGTDQSLIVRSSVVGESIWDRGTYTSIVIETNGDENSFLDSLVSAAESVLSSTNGRPSGLMIQQHILQTGGGEFGNLQRISKTRDHWEITTNEGDDITLRQRLNSQRDSAADPGQPLAAKPGLPRERLFGSIGAWLNNHLLLGKRERLNCEWVTDNRNFYLVQIDEEDEDLSGINPRQLRIEPSIQPNHAIGKFLRIADRSALSEWDKLKVLEELWEPNATRKPTLFYVPLEDLPQTPNEEAIAALAEDFRNLIGQTGIVVRTSVRAGAEKVPNLFRTDCLTPEAAANWCFEKRDALADAYELKQFAFVAHRFVAARSSAWVRADPKNPTVEIHALWGLPDALQYCPFDIWEVHVPTSTATDYPEYKSEMLIPKTDGGWEYARVKNEVARANSILTTDARDLAIRSLAISEQLGRACHIMWFVGCLDEQGNHFNIPWYWTEAHDTKRNPDRSDFRIVTVGNWEELDAFRGTEGVIERQAIEFRPSDLRLMRDTKFIEAVGNAAKEKGVAIILAGSTLGHAYYQLRKLDCIVVTPSEKRHARKRKSASLGKLVRDKIPEKIAERQEARATRQIDGKVRKSFLVTKLLEEALEVREAVEQKDKLEELADLFEVMRAIAKTDGISLEEVEAEADRKVEKAGGFEKGMILLETALTSSKQNISGFDAEIGSVLGDQTSNDVAEIPFSFFGFMKMDQIRAIHFEDLGIRLELTLRPDKLEIRLIKSSEQLDFDLNNEAASQ